MITYAKAGGPFDLHEAHRMLEDYRQATAPTSSSSSSAAVAPPLSEQPARQEVATVKTDDSPSDLVDFLHTYGDDNKEFVFITGNE